MIQLKCTNVSVIEKKSNVTGQTFDSTGEHLTRNKVYSSPGLIVDELGWLCYPINELAGSMKLAERFKEITTYAVTKSSKKKSAIKN